MSTQPDSEQTWVNPDQAVSLQLSSLQSRLQYSGIVDLYGVDNQRLTGVMRTLDDAFRGLRSATVPLGSVTTNEPDPREIGRFSIRGKLGAGGFATVYRAHDPLLLREVAIKVIPERKRPRLEHKRFLEARAVARLSHPNLVPLYEVFEEEGKFCLVSELCDGPTLAQWLKDHPGPVNPKLAVDILLRITDAVAHAHDHGLIHRDIKPGNILLVESKRSRDDLAFNPRLTDFGLVRDITAEPEAGEPNTIVGTLQYMAPEQLLTNTDSHRPSCDVFALGVLMYRMLTGRMPNASEKGMELLTSICCETPPLPRSIQRNLPRDLEAITLKCLQKDPKARYVSARELANDLRNWREGRPVAARHQSYIERTLRTISRAPLETALISTVILTMAVSAALLAKRNMQLKEQSNNLALAVQDASASANRATQAERKTRLALDEVSQQKKVADDSRVSAVKAAYLADMQLGYAALASEDYAELMEIISRMEGYTENVIPRSIDFQLLKSMGTRSFKPLKRHSQAVLELAVNPIRKEVIAGGEEGVLRFHSLDNGELLREINFGPFIHIVSLAVSPDGNQVAVGKRITFFGNNLKSYNRVELIDLSTKQQKTFGDFPSTIESLAFCDQGRMLAIGPRYEPVTLWSLEQNSSVKQVHSTRRNDELCVGANSGDLFLISDNQIISQVAVPTGEQKRAFNLSTYTQHIAVSPDEKWLVASTSEDHQILLFDLTDERTAEIARASCERSLKSISFSADSKHLLIGLSDGMIDIWDIKTNDSPNSTHSTTSMSLSRKVMPTKA